MQLVWTPDTARLQNQKTYLEDLLSKTATTLHTLREKQTRTDRILATGPSPRTKKKRIMQTRWRTGKTIKTCENEERVILDCLKVCNNNLQALQTLEACNYPALSEPNFTPLSWYTNATPDTPGVDLWNGFGDQCSPFQKQSQYMTAQDVEVAPHLTYEEAVLETLQPSAHTLVQFPVPSARRQAFRQSQPSLLSPLATTFQPDEEKHGTSPVKDKLTLAGLLSSNRVRQLRSLPKRRFSDAAVGHLFRCLSQPRFDKEVKYASWSPGPSSESTDEEDTIMAIRRKTRLRSTAF
ncbi:uncharacterized protein BDZ99DRAFT_458231 [Mytilinidion resinicola]|uniref:Uncharacterized protein n=1 Tax=Mytilinidion resinicola TaxID=574789 RepID=A0A6A6Z6B6_9PEZI|nr:uncharacterized protein BDZ99DRAFT_458231 [Mytilinidion resinicola]KAF2816358.1 hypothetical protein BDZ99DRAFT_458231 [Mytilinidion resinicola]